MVLQRSAAPPLLLGLWGAPQRGGAAQAEVRGGLAERPLRLEGRGLPDQDGPALQIRAVKDEENGIHIS